MGTKVNVSELQRRVKRLEQEKCLLEEVLPPSELREAETVMQAARRIVREWRGFRTPSPTFAEEQLRLCREELLRVRKESEKLREELEARYRVEAAWQEMRGVLTLPSGYVIGAVPKEAIGAFAAEHARAETLEAEKEKLLEARRWDQECIRRLEERAKVATAEMEPVLAVPPLPEATHSFVVSSTDDPLLAKVAFVIEVEPVPLDQVARLVADLQLGAEATEAAAQKRTRGS